MKIVCILSVLVNVRSVQVQREVVGRKECVNYQRAEIGDVITISFKAFLADGTIIDETAEEETFSYPSGTNVILNDWEKGLLGTCVGESVVMIIRNVIGKEDTEETSENKEINPRKPKQTIINDDKVAINVTLYLITEIEVITKFDTEKAQCDIGKHIQRGDKVTIKTTANLYTAELKEQKAPVLVTLHGDQLWAKDVVFSVGEELLLRNWNQGIEGACLGDTRRFIIGPNMEMGRIWNLSGATQIHNQASVVLDLVIVKVVPDNLLHHLYELLGVQRISKEHKLVNLLRGSR